MRNESDLDQGRQQASPLAASFKVADEQFGEQGGAMSNWTVYRIDGAGMWHFEDGDRAADWLSRLVGMGYRARMERVA